MGAGKLAPTTKMPSAPFKTYGAVLADLNKYFQATVTDRFYTPEQVHFAFDAWAAKRGVPPEDTAELRVLLVTHASNHPGFMNTKLKYLRDGLPHAFNVRGTWTSPRIPK